MKHWINSNIIIEPVYMGKKMLQNIYSKETRTESGRSLSYWKCTSNSGDPTELTTLPSAKRLAHSFPGEQSVGRGESNLGPVSTPHSALNHKPLSNGFMRVIFFPSIFVYKSNLSRTYFLLTHILRAFINNNIRSITQM